MTDILTRVAEVLSEQGIEEKKIMYIETKLRDEFCGGYSYVGRYSHHRLAQVRERIAESLKTSANFREISKRFDVSVSTVYRVAKKRGVK